MTDSPREHAAAAKPEPEPRTAAPERAARAKPRAVSGAGEAWSADNHRKAAIALFASVAITVLLYLVPHGHTIGYPLLLVSTVAHELGHGLAAQLVGATFHELVMSSDASGVASWSGDVGRFARAFISAGGLCGPALVAALGFALGRRQRSSRVALVVAGVFLVVLEIWVVRSAFGLLFIGLLAALCLGVGLKAPAWVSQLVLLLLSVQLALSVFSRGDYLFTATAQMASGPLPSDVAKMSEALFLPYWFWGALCGAFSVLVLVLGLWVFLRGTRTVSDLWSLVRRRDQAAPS